jgi:hypothetical protein
MVCRRSRPNRASRNRSTEGKTLGLNVRSVTCLLPTLRDGRIGNDADPVNQVVKIAIPRASGRKQPFARDYEETIHEAMKSFLRL